MAAKGLYTEELSEKIVNLIRAGNFASVAYGACGISHDTFYHWIKIKPEFAESIKKAKDERIASLVLHIKKDPSWQSKAWMLERLARDKFFMPTSSEKEVFKRLDQLEKRQNIITETENLGENKFRSVAEGKNNEH